MPARNHDNTHILSLPYQVAAGLAEVANSGLQDLDLEAPRVAYVVDGDAGGEAHLNRLRSAGISADRIVQLGGSGSGLSLEDVVKEDHLLEAINEVLKQSGSPAEMTRADLRAGTGRDAAVRTWCETSGSPRPRKPAVAVALLDLAAADKKLLTKSGARHLRELHRQVISAFGIQP